MVNICMNDARDRKVDSGFRAVHDTGGSRFPKTPSLRTARSADPESTFLLDRVRKRVGPGSSLRSVRDDVSLELNGNAGVAL